MSTRGPDISLLAACKLVFSGRNATSGTMGDLGDVNRLWVHVSCLGEGSLFSVYPTLLAELMAAAKEAAVSEARASDILLPSDRNWQDKIYYQLVEKQRNSICLPDIPLYLQEKKPASPWDTTIPQTSNKNPLCTLDLDSTSSKLSISSVLPITWTVSDIAKAACLLTVPPLPTNFLDENEMRRVYTLIYNVFRYKTILNEALTDVSFFGYFGKLVRSRHLVWLLLYDMYHRKFKEREAVDAAECESLFARCGLTATEVALWAKRVKLAAAMSRLRVAQNALRLSELLPPHLRDDRISKQNDQMPFTCWVNSIKVKSPTDIIQKLESKLNLKMLPLNDAVLGPFNFRWDALCPLFLSFHQGLRSMISESSLIDDNLLVMQNRSFCYGPAIFCKVLTELNLTGSVIQTHPTSPRAVAYLATLLSKNVQISSLMIFGVGDRKDEYEQYMKKLGLTKIVIYWMPLIDMSADADIMEHVVGVFVTPPNSYSAVNDPIDLICSRGGDLMMLENLTDTEASSEGQSRVSSMLEQQHLALRYSMSRPQIQFVLYETHSQLNAENKNMVRQTLQEVNRAAQIKHAELLGKISLTSNVSKSEIPELEINNNEGELKRNVSLETADSPSKLIKKQSVFSLLSIENEDEILRDVHVPDTDIFEESAIPDLCYNVDSCLDLMAEGCYLALLKRKEVIMMDANYMIKMAESRGLFGNASANSPKKIKSSRIRKPEKPVEPVKPRRRGRIKIERIAAQTHASMMRNCDRGDVPCRCPRHREAENPYVKTSPAKIWWGETVRYLTKCKKNLVRQKVINKEGALLVKTNTESIMKDIENIDELIHTVQCTKSIGIPGVPKLKLTRLPVKISRVSCPVTVKNVEFPIKKKKY